MLVILGVRVYFDPRGETFGHEGKTREMGDIVNLRIAGPGWWLDMIGVLRLRLRKEVAEGGLRLPLTVTDDATDGGLLHVTMDVNGNFSAQGNGLTPASFPLAATIIDSDGPHPLTI
jgi:hypothetical protein